MMMELSENVDNAVDLANFKDLLLQTCGHTFEQEREQALAAALARRMATLNVRRHDSYHARLLHDRDELLRLTELLTVNETYFFREPEHLRLMVENMPEFMTGCGQRPVRILSAGCSTGEEPYSIAIMLRERFGADGEQRFAITGVDIDSTAIATARQGVYGESSFRGIGNALLQRYFQPLGAGRFRIGEAIRKQVEFEVVNLLDDAYTQKMQAPDIILYRNVSIYFPGQVQQKIFRKLAELLVDGGCLLVGATETMHHDLGILSLVKHDSLFYYRKTPRAYFQERRSPGGFASPAVERRRHVAHVMAAVRPTDAEVGRMPSPDTGESYGTALALARDRRADDALAMLDGIIAQDASFIGAYTLKANLLLNAGCFGEVADICNQAIARGLLCPEIHLMLGMVARQQGDDDDALKRFREALYLDASCCLAHFYSAEIHYGRGDQPRARRSYEAAARILEKTAADAADQGLLPLAVNVDQFVAVCRHKLSLLTGKKT